MLRLKPYRLLLAVFLYASLGGTHADPVQQGAYLYKAANCYSCHTDSENSGKPLAGGRALESPFGTFYSPNITPDTTTGIGSWSDDDFIQALKHGQSPQGNYYFPAFPYPAYRNMTEQDMLAIKAYLFTQPAFTQENRDHQLDWYVSRWLMPIWNWLDTYYRPQTNPASRAEYLVDTLGHCGECHTPRKLFGLLDWTRYLQGNKQLSAPDLASPNADIQEWSDSEFTDFFRDGMFPDGDYVSDHMAEVVDQSTSKWSGDDLKIVIQYLKQLNR